MTTADTASIPTTWLIERLPGRSAREIGDGIRALIAAGELLPGQQLPTIRELARVAEVSPGTVLTAWNYLRSEGLIETHRRGGTIVLDPRSRPASSDTRPSWSQIDFLQCAPDITLQPDLREALLESLEDSSLNVFGREYMTERLQTAAEQTWPFEAQAWSTAGGGTEALLLAVAAASDPGDLVAVDEPASPGLLDTLRDLSLTPIPVSSDESGPTPESLRAAFDKGAGAFIFQPGSEFAVDRVVSEERAAGLAEIAGGLSRVVWIVEDDAIGPLSSRPSPTLGRWLPDRVIRVRSYCKAYGIDVRTSVLGGSSELVARSIMRRSHGVGSNSRILQNALAHLITDQTADAVVRRAREAYRRRRDLLVAALHRHGLVTHSGDTGLVVWVEVADETDALVALASRGISVAPARKAFISPPEADMIRISPLQIPEDPLVVADLAAIIAMASEGTARQFFD